MVVKSGILYCSLFFCALPMAVRGSVVKAKVETVRARTAVVPGVTVRNTVPSVPARKAAAAVKSKVLTAPKGSAAKGKSKRVPKPPPG